MELFVFWFLTIATVSADGDRDGDRISVCYEDLGCIHNDLSWLDPMHRPINLLPLERDQINTQFFLHTRTQPKIGTLIETYNQSTIADSNFQSSRPTKFVIHGFVNNRNTEWVQRMIENLLIHDDYNVIVVDWSGGSFPPYTQATANTRLVGLEIAYLINILVNQFEAQVGDIHLIGFSLGAHLCGYAGEKIAGLGRITGLDPAGPYFQGMPAFVRLDASDAKFVDVIHTNGAPSFLKGCFGYEQPCGHVDFYPNGGIFQPGCGMELEQDPSSLFVDSVGCSHRRSTELFIDSLISNCTQVAYECNSFDEYEKGLCHSCGSNNLNCAPLGIYADAYPSRSRTGVKLYSNSASVAPFCQYQWRVSVTLAKPFFARSTVYGSLEISVLGDEPINQQLTYGAFPMVHGNTYRFVIDETIDIGFVKAIALAWSFRWNPFDLDTYCFFFCNQGLYVANVQVSKTNTYPESSRLAKTFTFCPNAGFAYARISSRLTYMFHELC